MLHKNIKTHDKIIGKQKYNRKLGEFTKIECLTDLLAKHVNSRKEGRIEGMKEGGKEKKGKKEKEGRDKREERIREGGGGEGKVVGEARDRS